MKLQSQRLSANNYCSSEGQSIMLLNAILKNNEEQVIEIFQSVLDLEKLLNSVFIQQKGKIIDGPIDLVSLATDNKCSPCIVKNLESFTKNTKEKSKYYSLTEPMNVKPLIDKNYDGYSSDVTSLVGENMCMEE